MQHTFFNYQEASIYSSCVQHFMQNQEALTDIAIIEYINNATPQLSDAGKKKVVEVAMVALYSDVEESSYKADIFQHN